MVAEGGVDAPAETHDDLPEAVLPDVVAGPEDEGAVDLLFHGLFRGVTAGDPPVGGGGPPSEGNLHDPKPLLEPRSRGHDGPPAVHHVGAAVEDQVVLPSHLVHVDEGAPGLARPPPEEGLPLLPLPGVEGGGGEVQDEFGPPRRQRRDRPPLDPEVLAHGNPHLSSREPPHPRGAVGDEVALLVEDVIRGKAPLPLGPDPPAVFEESRSVQAALLALLDEPHDGREAPGLGEEVRHGPPVLLHEPGDLHEVLGGVTRDRQLREDHETGPPGPGLPEGLRDFPEVPLQVAHDGVGLGQGDAEGGRSAPPGAGTHGGSLGSLPQRP